MADVGHGEPIDRCSLCHGDACPFTGSSTVYDRAFGPEEPELTDRVASLADEPDTWLQGDAFPVGSRRDYHGVSGLGDIDGGDVTTLAARERSASLGTRALVVAICGMLVSIIAQLQANPAPPPTHALGLDD